MINTGISTTEIKKSAKVSEDTLLSSLKERFFKDISANMIFYCFNVLNSRVSIADEGGKKDVLLSDHFKKAWIDGTKKQIEKELKIVNDGATESMNLRLTQAICDYQIPSTEEVQSVYNQALTETIKVFDAGISGKGRNQGNDKDGYDL